MANFPDHFGASDDSPATLDIRVCRGDDWNKDFYFAHVHRDLSATPPRDIETPIPLEWRVFGSAVFHSASLESFEEFQISDLPANGVGWVNVRLDAKVTAAMEPGTYGFWIASNDVIGGDTRTWIKGTITILERPEPPSQ